VIDSGTVRQIGTPREIYEEPSDTFVATFLGSPPMNLIPRGDDLIGFRPETFHLADPASDDSSASISFDLSSIREEYLGSEKLVYGEVEGVRAVARMAANAALPVAEGGSVRFTVRNPDLRIFEKDTGLRKAPPIATVPAGASS
jgi:multiple sugar transport system ATP-binding protein